MFKHTVARLRLAGVSLICGVYHRKEWRGDFVRWDLEMYVPILGIDWVVEVKKARKGGDKSFIYVKKCFIRVKFYEDF